MREGVEKLKKILLVFLVVSVMGMGIGSVVNAAMAVDGYINIGDYNDDVIAVHRKLGELGYYGLRAESPWSEASIAALKLTQAAIGLEPTGKFTSDIEYIDAPLNLVWDGNFEDIENRWDIWNKPTVVETVEADGKTWMHLVSSGEHWEGLMQGIGKRSGLSQLPELHAGR